MSKPRSEYKQGQVVFNLSRKSFGRIDDIQFIHNKGHLHTVEYVDEPKNDKQKRYGRYYEDRMKEEFVAMQNTDMAYVLFGDDK